MVNGLITLAFGVTLTFFSGFHAYLLFTASTTIECAGRQDYNEGWKENFMGVFGRRWWEWLLPVQRLSGDGYEFADNVGLLQPNAESDEPSDLEQQDDVDDQYG